MWEYSDPSSSSANNEDNADIQMILEDECNQGNGASLWSVDDDTMFFAQGLKHHSAGKGKSVYVTWNENYLLNFVFKSSSKTGATTLTKVRISMPIYEQEMEEIANMLILEMNTLLYMKSGRVYYFSSVKSMHRIDWLTGVRCMTTCPQTQFSIIRVENSKENNEMVQSRKLCLNVYKDVPQLGKSNSDKHILRHSYDISFDVDNIFNCDWLDETFTLLSLLTNEKNLEFLKDLVSIGNVFRPDVEKIVLENKQEVHIFTISGNVFILVGAIANENELQTACPEVEEYSIRLLNTYASNIECIHIDCEKNLFIILLQSGHMDIWYKSHHVFGSIFHHYHQISTFLSYDYQTADNTFYFTTEEDIIQLKVVTSNAAAIEKECITRETRKSIGGMIACTWVENLQQLICLSFNNIFYRICFPPLNELTENETRFEKLNNLYVLNSARVDELMNKAAVLNELIKQPKRIHEAIDKEFEKQQILAFGSKQEILRKLFQCHIEYHVYMPNINYFEEDCIQIKTLFSSHTTDSVFCLIFLSLKNKKNFLKSLFNSSTFYLHISNQQQGLILHLTKELLEKSVCFVVQTAIKAPNNMPEFSLNLLSFVNHNANYLCLKFNLLLECNAKTYQHIYSSNIEKVSIFRNSLHDIEKLIETFNRTKSESMDCCEKIYEFQHLFKIKKNLLNDIMHKFGAKPALSMHFKLYYLYRHSIELKYEESKEVLQISSHYPEAIYYLKLFLIHTLKDFNVLSTIMDEMQKKIMNYQCDIESSSAPLLSLEHDINTNMLSMHLENLRKVYLKLRCELYDMFR